MAEEKQDVAGIQILHSRIAALEQLLEVYENSVVEQADKLYGEIAERSRAEEEIKELLLQNRMILESAGEGIYGLDLEGKTTFTNPAGTRMIGYEPEDIIGKLQHAILHHTRPDGTPYPKEECPIYAAFKTGTTHHVDNEVFWKKDGASFPVEYTSTPIWKDGKLTGAVVVFKDITDRREAEKEIRRLHGELEQKVEERTRQLLEAQEELVRQGKLAILGQLSGSVGHELRNPLGVMSNAVYFLKLVLAQSDETVMEYLGIIESEIANSLKIITDLLDFARTKAPQTKVVTARQLADESLGRCVIAENIDLQIEIPDDLPLLRVDPSQMIQVLTNFITNAVQAMPDGGALRLSARCAQGTGNRNQELGTGTQTSGLKEQGSGKAPTTDPRFPIPDTSFIEISVTDTGYGIAPENMKKLFQPLFTTKVKGIGLGLVVCKNLVETTGGRIEVESEWGKGTTFTVLLPIERRKI
ncbi:MAG: PAS domain S-box protein [Desulfuromonadales bacterium]|nr:PAS domain S-box protein [Desulfuromonadales bacterium]